MLSSSEDKAIDLLQLLPTLSKTYPPLSRFIYCPMFPIQNIKQSSSYRTAYIPISLKYVENIDYATIGYY